MSPARPRLYGDSRLFFVIPVFNEAENLPRLFSDLAALGTFLNVGKGKPKFLLVDDGSSDNTVQVARQLGGGLDLMVLSHERNSGPGASFATAFSWLADHITPDDWIITIEGDNTSRLELLEQMFVRTCEGYDVILASPYAYGGGISNTNLLRIVLSAGANLFVKDFLGLNGLLTVSSFFRLFRGRALIDLQKIFGGRILECRGFECMVELLLKLVMRNEKISEVPMQLDTSRRIGRSKMRILRVILGYISLFAKRAAWAEACRKFPAA